MDSRKYKYSGAQEARWILRVTGKLDWYREFRYTHNIEK